MIRFLWPALHLLEGLQQSQKDEPYAIGTELRVTDLSTFAGTRKGGCDLPPDNGLVSYSGRPQE